MASLTISASNSSSFPVFVILLCMCHNSDNTNNGHCRRCVVCECIANIVVASTRNMRYIWLRLKWWENPMKFDGICHVECENSSEKLLRLKITWKFIHSLSCSSVDGATKQQIHHMHHIDIKIWHVCVTDLVSKKEIISIVNELQSIWNSISISVSIVTACMRTSGECEWKERVWRDNG